jgi:hypothetical protein
MVIMNIGGLEAAEGGAADVNGLAAMKATFSQIASSHGMFGEVPNAANAAEALARAADKMLTEMDAASRTVDDIRRSARAAADTGEAHDAAAHQTLSRAQSDNVSLFDFEMETRHPTGDSPYRSAHPSSGFGPR